MESSPELSALERVKEELGKAEGSETTKSSSVEGESARRQRNSQGPRAHACSCGKAYMSWAAFYTHCKTKHPGQVPHACLRAPAGHLPPGPPLAKNVN